MSEYAVLVRIAIALERIAKVLEEHTKIGGAFHK